MSIVNFIKNNFAYATVPRCHEKGCTLRIDDLDKNKYVIIKGEKIHNEGKKCDCIIFKVNGDIIIGIIELKSKKIHVNENIEKLKNCSKIALDILKRYNEKYINFKFFHIILCKRWHSSEIVILRNRKIEIKGTKYNIISGRCGVKFSELMSKYN